MPIKTSRPTSCLHAVIVLAKQPRPGRVKTRLGPDYTPDESALLAGAALRDTLDEVDALGPAQRVLCFDGDAGDWAPSGWRVVRQPHGPLEDRIASAFAAVGRRPAALVGMDTPHLSAVELARFDPGRYDACLGRARDGGYWVIGFADPAHARAALRGIPMSQDDTGARQLRRLHELDLRVQLLAELEDVDTAPAAHRVARLAPDTRFARQLSALGSVRVA